MSRDQFYLWKKLTNSLMEFGGPCALKMKIFNDRTYVNFIPGIVIEQKSSSKAIWSFSSRPESFWLNEM